MTLAFADAEPIEDLDSVPETEAVEYPCKECGREAGPYSGRGPKPKLCPACKPVRKTSSRTPRVSGNAASLAAQAAGVLEQLNGIIAAGCMVTGFNDTAHAIAAANGGFKEAAYEALLTDPDLCKLLLRGGVKSAKVSLAIAYVGMGTMVLPVAMAEFKDKKAERQARKEAEEESAD